MNIFSKIKNWVNIKRKYRGFTLMEDCMRKGKGIMRRMNDREILESLEDKYNYELSILIDELEVTKIKISNNAIKYTAFLAAMSQRSVIDYVHRDGIYRNIEIIDFVPGSHLKLVTKEESNV